MSSEDDEPVKFAGESQECLFCRSHFNPKNAARVSCPARGMDWNVCPKCALRHDELATKPESPTSRNRDVLAFAPFRSEPPTWWRPAPLVAPLVVSENYMVNGGISLLLSRPSRKRGRENVFAQTPSMPPRVQQESTFSHVQRPIVPPPAPMNAAIAVLPQERQRLYYIKLLEYGGLIPEIGKVGVWQFVLYGEKAWLRALDRKDEWLWKQLATYSATISSFVNHADPRTRSTLGKWQEVDFGTAAGTGAIPSGAWTNGWNGEITVRPFSETNANPLQIKVRSSAAQENSPTGGVLQVIGAMDAEQIMKFAGVSSWRSSDIVNGVHISNIRSNVAARPVISMQPNAGGEYADDIREFLAKVRKDSEETARKERIRLDEMREGIRRDRERTEEFNLERERAAERAYEKKVGVAQSRREKRWLERERARASQVTALRRRIEEQTRSSYGGHSSSASPGDPWYDYLWREGMQKLEDEWKEEDATAYRGDS